MVLNKLNNITKICFGALLILSWGLEAKTDPAGPKHLGTQATEFYFVRHGQTDHNIGLIKDYDANIALNATGKKQVVLLKRFIETTLPIRVICTSPLLRALQTADIINEQLHLPVIVMPDFAEGSRLNWIEIQSVKNKKVWISKSLQTFLNRLKRGLENVLQQQGPVLIVSHGGVYSALCRVLNINSNSWRISNCSVVRFYKKADGSWHVQEIFDLKKEL